MKARQGLLPRTSLEEERIRKGLCVSCETPLTGRRTVYCSDKCEIVYWSKHSWSHLRNKILFESNLTCKKCGFHLEKNPDYPEAIHFYVCTAPKTDERLGTGYSYEPFVVDHIIPIALGGEEFNPENLQVLCTEYNKEKTKIDISEINWCRREEKKRHRANKIFSLAYQLTTWSSFWSTTKSQQSLDVFV